MKQFTIGVFGDDKWCHLFVKKIFKEKKINIKFICGRYKTNDKILKKIAIKNKTKFLAPKNINSQKFINSLNNNKCDLYCSMSYNQIFSTKTINKMSKSIINCHAGKLPFYRGRSVLNWAIINGEKFFGITVHYIDHKIDTGKIILQKNIDIKKKDYFNDVLQKAYKNCPLLLLKAVKQIKKKKHKTIDQKKISKSFSYYKKRKEGDEIIDWSKKSIEIYNFIRGLSFPGPIAKSYINKKKISIMESSVLDLKLKTNERPGTILNIKKNKIFVKTIDGKVLCINKWLSSYSNKLKVGDIFL